MILTDLSREAAMIMLCAMTVEELAYKTGQDTETAFKQFRRSNTYSMLFEPDTGLWLNGPDYVAEEFMTSCA